MAKDNPATMLLKLRNIFTFLIWWLIPFGLLGQMEQAKRIEIEQSPNDDEEHQVISLGTNGLFLISSRVSYLHKTLSLSFTKYDTTLTENWHINYNPEDRYELVKTYENGRNLFLFFREESTTNFSILRIDFESGDKSITEGQLPVNMDIDYFIILKSKAFIGGKYNERPVVVQYSFFDSSVKVLPELHANQLIINEMDVNELTENVYITLKNERTCQYTLKVYSYDGKLISNGILGERNHNPISGKILNFNPNNNLMVGSYAKACSPLSEGIYLHYLESNKFQYVNFADLKNFFKFLKPKRERKVLEKINQKKQQGKEIKLHYRMLLHNLIPYQDGFLLLAEIFYPEYRQPSNVVFNSVRAYRLGSEIYNNFRYTHAIICNFDKNGKLLWDNCFPLENLESTELNQKTQITIDNDIFIMAYPKEGVIKTEVIQGEQSLKPIEDFSLKSNSDDERIAESTKTSLTSWYDRNFIAYGYQTIKNTKISSNSREVFFLNKLHYLPK